MSQVHHKGAVLLFYFRKNVVRHRVAFVTTAIVMLALLVGMVTSMWLAARLRMTLRKLHDELIEKVILNAQSNDGEGTSTAMELARESGVPPTKLQMLEGIVCYYGGNNKSAIQNLEGVLALEPNNVTARAMLALSYGHYGEWNKYNREIMRIGNTEEVAERKDYEALILGCALLYTDTGQCLDMLQETVDSHPEWAVARAMLGGAKGHRALELPDAALAEKALQDTRLAQGLRPNNRVVALYNVWTHRVAIYFARSRGEDYGTLRQDAEASIRLLKESYTEYTAGAYNIAAFYDVIGENDAAIDVLSKAIGDADYDDWTGYYVSLLIGCGRRDEALRLLDTIQVRSVSGRVAKANLLATMPERREEAEVLCNSLLNEPDPVDARSYAIAILCLLGEQAKVRTESRKCLELLGKQRVPNLMPEKYLAFHAGKTIDEFAEDCGETAIGRMTFHYHVAMRKLSEGDREGAIRHFDECATSSLIDNGYFTSAKAFLRILADNQNWPEQK